jgi:ABC-type phosphate transport system substrate-binding protein
MLKGLARIVILSALAAWPLADAAGTLAIPPNLPQAQLGAVSEPLAIVINRTNPVNDISFNELRKIFLGNRSYWANGRRITLVMREPDEPERRTILRDLCEMSEDQLKTHYLHGLFTGEILVSPKTLSSPMGVRKFIFNVPGAIGYLRIEDVDDSVKIVRIDGLDPGNKGYKLRVLTKAAITGE